jgi:hypothetical protein
MGKIAISKRNEYAYTATPQDRKRNEAEKGKNSFSEAKKNFSTRTSQDQKRNESDEREIYFLANRNEIF